MRTRRTVWLVATLVVLPWLTFSVTRGAQKEWVSVGLGGGGGIFCPVNSPYDPNLMFCSSDMSGVYRSTDGGKTWRMLPFDQLSGALTDSIVFHPKDPNAMYCLPGNYNAPILRMSTDKGLTWQPVTRETPWLGKVPCAPKFAIDPTGSVMMVGSDKGLWYSDDGGKTWTKSQGIDKQVIGYVFDASKDAKLWFVATADAVLRSTDAGRTWQPCAGQPGNSPIKDFCGGTDADSNQVALFVTTPSKEVNGKFAGAIFRSEDRGQTWQHAMGEGINKTVGPHNDIERKPAEYPLIAMASNQTKILYTYCEGNGDAPPRHAAVYRTQDAGRTWRCVEYFRPEWKGNNVEWSWIRFDRGTMGSTLGFSVNPRNSDIVMYSDFMELYLTTDGGKTWRQAYTRCADGQPGPNKAWQSTGLEMTTTWQYRFDPHEKNRHYICYTDVGFARSEDGGKSWYWSPRGSPWENTFYDLECDPDVPGRLYAACAFEHDIPSWKMAQSLYGGGGVCISNDFGKTWQPSADGMPQVGACTAVEIDHKSPKDARVLYASIWGGGIYKSVDGGKSWQAKNKGLPIETNDHFTDIRLHKDGTLLALLGGKKHSRYEMIDVNGLFRSTDGGESWECITKNVKVYLPYGFDVQQDDSNVIWLGVCTVPRQTSEGGAYRTTDGGKTWVKMNIPIPEDGPKWLDGYWPNIDPRNPKRVWLTTGTHGTLVTTDFGKTWKPVAGLPFRPCSRVVTDPDDPETIWVTTFGGGVWRGPALGKE